MSTWYAPLLEAGATLKEIIEYKDSLARQEYNELCSERIAKLEQAIADGLITDKGLKNRKESIKTDLVKKFTWYNPTTMGGRLEEGFPIALRDEHGERLAGQTGSPASGRYIIEEVLAGRMGLNQNLIDFFCSDLGIASDDLFEILSKKVNAAFVPEQGPENVVEENTEGSIIPKLVVRNKTDRNVVLKAHYNAGKFYIDILPDKRVETTGKHVVEHLRATVYRYVGEEKDENTERDHETKVIDLNGRPT